MQSSTWKHSAQSRKSKPGHSSGPGNAAPSPLRHPAGGGPSFGPLLAFWARALRIRWLPDRATRDASALIERRLAKALPGALAPQERRRLARAALLHRATARLLPLSPEAVFGDRSHLAPGAGVLTLSTWFDEELRAWLGRECRLVALAPPCLEGRAALEQLASGADDTGKWRLIRYVRTGTSGARVHLDGELTGPPRDHAAGIAEWLDGIFRQNPALYRWYE